MSDAVRGGRRDDVEERLIERAARDPVFRAQLIRDPTTAVEGALSEFTGGSVKLPAHLRVFVHEETADTFHLVLPPGPAAAGELSDAELALVAGGHKEGTFLCQTP